MLARFWTRLLMAQYLAQISTSSGPGSEVGLDNRPPTGHALPRDVGRLCWCRSSLGPLGRSGRRERRRNSEERGDQVRISCGAFDEMFESNSEPGWPALLIGHGPPLTQSIGLPEREPRRPDSSRAPRKPRSALQCDIGCASLLVTVRTFKNNLEAARVSTLQAAGAIEDSGHPIPRLDTLDVHLTTDQGAYVGIVVASPLRDDTMSRARLQQKVEVSLSYFQSAEYRETYGLPCRERSRLWINVHYDSDATMLQLIEHYRAQIEANGITAVVNLIGTS
jgi:hypothetical protein